MVLSAGPVVAAAVILPVGLHICGVDDSKKLSAATRDELFELIMAQAVSVGIGYGDHVLVDRVNILQATLAAMKQAVMQLAPAPTCSWSMEHSRLRLPWTRRPSKKGMAPAPPLPLPP